MKTLLDTIVEELESELETLDLWRPQSYAESDVSEEADPFELDFYAALDSPTKKVESEISRSSKTYIRWVQRALNKVLGISLSVDGIKGSRTREAVRAFQRRFGLTVDGVVGRQTEATLTMISLMPPPKTSSPSSPPAGSTTGGQTSASTKGPYPMVNALMPKEGPGFYCRMPQSRRWALPETIQALQEIGRQWRGPRIIISDISKRGGGPLCFSSGFCHASHQVGLDVDIRTMRNDGKDSSSGSVSYQSKNYSLELTSRLIDTIRSNGVLRIKTIGFLDRRIPNLSRWSGHSKHLHVRFCMPAKYRSSINFRKTYPKTPPDYRC